MIKNLSKNLLLQQGKDYAQMLLGIFIFSLGYTCFLLPYEIISGGISGISTLIYYSTGFHANYSYLIINVFLLFLGVRVMGWNYVIKTIIATLLISFFIGALQEQIMTEGPDGTEVFKRIVGEQKFMAAAIGGLLEGLGMAVVFLSGGSTGGMDIIASSINKYLDISLGRLLLTFDILIVGSSFFISQELETVVVGYVTMLISMTFLDYIINGARQSVQFIIVSEKYEEIATKVNTDLERGVTVLEGKGYYSKEKRPVLLILAKKSESRRIFSFIRNIDGKAFVSMSNVEGVFGEGFDKIKR